MNRLQDYDGSEDIRNFCCDAFEKICKTHPMKRSIPESWPVEVTLNELVNKSSGILIVPSQSDEIARKGNVANTIIYIPLMRRILDIIIEITGNTNHTFLLGPIPSTSRRNHPLRSTLHCLCSLRGRR